MNAHSLTRPSALSLTEDCIAIVIRTPNPAADAARYMSAMQRTVRIAIQSEYVDHDDLQEVYSLLEFLEKLNPVPDENELKERILPESGKRFFNVTFEGKPI